jgi:TPP-dependent trihydroxycyclohexane-1,2-dione (THcHDO) dehydratase
MPGSFKMRQQAMRQQASQGTKEMVALLDQEGYERFNRWAQQKGFMLEYVLHVHHQHAQEKSLTSFK